MNVLISPVVTEYNYLAAKCLEILRKEYFERTGREMPEAASEILGLDREMSHTWWSDMEAGRTMVPFGFVVAFAQIMGVDLEELMGKALHRLAHERSIGLLQLATRPAPAPPERPSARTGRPRGPARNKEVSSLLVGQRVGRLIDEIRLLQQQPPAGVAEHHPVENDGRPQEGGENF